MAKLELLEEHYDPSFTDSFSTAVAAIPTSRSVAWSGNWIQVITEGRWEYVARTRDVTAAAILAVTDIDQIVLVEQYRAALGQHCLEIPAGLVGDEIASEVAIASAQRELEEETGFQAAHWSDLGEFHTSPGMSSESFRLFRASGLRKISSGGGIGDHEAITVHLIDLGQVLEFISAKRAQGCAIDVKLLAALPFLFTSRSI